LKSLNRKKWKGQGGRKPATGKIFPAPFVKGGALGDKIKKFVPFTQLL
jgi:hypothetical protein